MSSAPCPVAQCNQHLDGQEGVTTGTVQQIPVSTPPSTFTAYTPVVPIAFDKGLGCTAGLSGAGNYANAVAGSPTPLATPTDTPCGGGSCLSTATPLPTSTPVPGPFVLNLHTGGSASAPTLNTNWTSAAYTGPPTLPCTGAPIALDSQV